MPHEDRHIPLTDEVVRFPVPAEEAGERLDVFLARRLSQFSRNYLQRAIYAGAVQLHGPDLPSGKLRPNYKLRLGQVVEMRLPQPPPEGPLPEDIPLDVLYEDRWIIVVNKPPGMVVHPAAGHWEGTLVSALQHHFDQLSQLGGPVRPGIVHRLDRDTSGVMVVARNDLVHAKLSKQFSRRRVEKEYWALVQGSPARDRDVVELPIGRHLQHRHRMSTAPGSLRPRQAETFYEVLERFEQAALLRVLPRTGRTHQIRVHLAAVGHPVLGDHLYGGRAEVRLRELLPRDWFTHPGGPLNRKLRGVRLPEEQFDRLQKQLDQVVLSRQALHARRLKFLHPESRQMVQFTAPVPEDIQQALTWLRLAQDNRLPPQRG